MTTVADIRAGKTCPGCSADCRNFVDESDCCIYLTFISELYSKVIEDESNKEVHYEPVEKKQIIVKMLYDDELEPKGLSIKTLEELTQS